MQKNLSQNTTCILTGKILKSNTSNMKTLWFNKQAMNLPFLSATLYSNRETQRFAMETTCNNQASTWRRHYSTTVILVLKIPEWKASAMGRLDCNTTQNVQCNLHKVCNQISAAVVQNVLPQSLTGVSQYWSEGCHTFHPGYHLFPKT